MDPLAAKVVAAVSGGTLTSLTMTPFDVVKTRLQTQPPLRFSAQTCCLPSHMPCVRSMSSLATVGAARLSPSLPPSSAAGTFSAGLRTTVNEVVCLWDRGGSLRTERVNGFTDAVRKVWRAEGARGLWKGVGTTLLIAVPSQTAYMITYDQLLNTIIPNVSPTPLVTPFISGILARTLVSTLSSPLELVRTNLQATPISPSHPHTFRGVLAGAGNLVRDQGVQALWRGLGPTLWRDVPFSGIYWATYESWKAFFRSRGREGADVAFVCGSLSGTTAAMVTQPFDVLKTRRQAVLMSSRSFGSAPSSLELARRIIATEGASALLAGLTPRMAKIAPACGIMIASYEGVGRLLAKP